MICCWLWRNIAPDCIQQTDGEK